MTLSIADSIKAVLMPSLTAVNGKETGVRGDPRDTEDANSDGHSTEEEGNDRYKDNKEALLSISELH